MTNTRAILFVLTLGLVGAGVASASSSLDLRSSEAPTIEQSDVGADAAPDRDRAERPDRDRAERPKRGDKRGGDCRKGRGGPDRQR